MQGNKNGNLDNKIASSRDPDQLVKTMIASVENSPQQKRLILYRLLSELVGDDLGQEVPIYNPDGGIYAYLIPPGERLRLRLLEDPQFAAELTQRSQVSGTGTLQELLNKLQSGNV